MHNEVTGTVILLLKWPSYLHRIVRQVMRKLEAGQYCLFNVFSCQYYTDIKIN